MNGIIVGGSGLVGRNCLAEMARTPEYDTVISLVRRPTGQNPGKVQEQVVNFDELGTLVVPAGSDVFCALGTTRSKAGSEAAFRKVDLEYPVALAKRTLECGARQFIVVSSVGAHKPRNNFYLQVKREMEDAVSALPFEAVHILRPGFLLGEREETRPMETIAAVVTRTLSFALGRYKPIDAAQVGAAMVRIALERRPGVHIYHYDEIIAR